MVSVAANDHVAVGFTDYGPHYSNATLGSIVVAQKHWTHQGYCGVGITENCEGFPAGDWQIQFGYPEGRPRFISDSAEGSSISLVVTSKTSHVKIIGTSLNVAEVYVELHVDASRLVGRSYVEPSPHQKWEQISLESKSIELRELPDGTHVVTLKVKLEGVAISHVLTWAPISSE